MKRNPTRNLIEKINSHIELLLKLVFKTKQLFEMPNCILKYFFMLVCSFRHMF